MSNTNTEYSYCQDGEGVYLLAFKTCQKAWLRIMHVCEMRQRSSMMIRLSLPARPCHHTGQRL
jgi:hypothetical protein